MYWIWICVSFVLFAHHLPFATGMGKFQYFSRVFILKVGSNGKGLKIWHK